MSNKELTIADIEKYRNIAEKSIMEMISIFQDKTGVCISSVDLFQAQEVGERHPRVRAVLLDLKL